MKKQAKQPSQTFTPRSERDFFNWFARYERAAKPDEYQIRLNRQEKFGTA